MKRALSTASLAASFAIAVAFSALAGDVDPTRAARLSGGAPDSVTRIDRARTGRVRRLPEQPVATARMRVLGALQSGVAVARDGFAAVTADDSLVLLDPSGHERVRLALGAPCSHSPVIMASGDVVVMTDGGDVLAVSASGRPRFRTHVEGSSRDVPTGLLPMLDGTVVVARGARLHHLSDEGRLLASAAAPDTVVGALLGEGHAVLAITAAGVVVRWRGSGPVTTVGALGGPPTTAAALQDGKLFDVVEAHRLVVLDVARAELIASFDLPFSLDAPALTRTGSAVLSSSAGLLLELGADGRERARNPLPAGPSRSPLADTALAAGAPPVLVDEDGRVAFVRPTGEVGVFSPPPSALPSVAEERACAHPIALTETGGRLVISCSDGTIALYGASGASAP